MKNQEINEILNSLTIAYVEDEKNIRENMSKTLNLLCNNCIDFQSAEELLNYYEKNSVHIIITDINLPNMNGIELIKKIREKDEKIPIILLTAYIETQYLFDAIKYKVVEYLPKPIDYETLIQALLKATKDLINNGNYMIKINEKLFFNVLNKELLTIDKEKIPLTPKELKLLNLFIKNKNKIVTYEEIKNQIWENSYEVTESAFKNLINKLRNKISKDSIVNISKIGYRLNIKD
ncbi:two-component system response regulator [Malaciobacter marinus]|uniref:Transcriptional regulator n=1 Tax=Malaciobacter marinus TaxID=505249 RepID=A0A347TNV4_9BACT|nr:response regulator transcription factor [Malaciobacter marinus]AXX88282.1 two-component system response regulator [Malaciobacter marinus]PHO14146.1 transcriptional regulator [Malaciobacter marinus]